MATAKPRFNVHLDDDRKAKLERIRIQHGLRSWAQAIHFLIDKEAAG